MASPTRCAGRYRKAASPVPRHAFDKPAAPYTASPAPRHEFDEPARATDRLARQDRIEKIEAAERIEPTEATEAIDNTEAQEPIDPADSDDPTDPMDSTEFFEEMLSSEFSDAIDHRDLRFLTLPLSAMPRLSGRSWRRATAAQ